MSTQPPVTPQGSTPTSQGTLPPSPKSAKNIYADERAIPDWAPAQPEESLNQIYLYVLNEAAKSIHWYWANKRSKAFWSRLIRFVVWALAAVWRSHADLGSLLAGPQPQGSGLTNGLWPSLFLGVAAALLGLDKGFGFSSGWARYVLTATNIRKSLEEFRLDWTVLRAKAGSQPTPEGVAPLIERAKQFRSDIESWSCRRQKTGSPSSRAPWRKWKKMRLRRFQILKRKLIKRLRKGKPPANRVQSN